MTHYRTKIEYAATAHGLDSNLVEAVVLAESSGHTDAFRFEPAFYERYIKGKPEYLGQVPRRVSSSYGLMQCMFTTAVQHGYIGKPEGLFLPDVGLLWGCVHLASLLKWSSGDVPKALAAYNGGKGNWKGTHPQAYAQRVLRLLKSVEAGR